MPKDYKLEDVQKTGTYVDVSRELLRKVPLPPAGERTRWFGVQHGELVDGLQEAITSAGLEYDEDSWTLSGKGERLFGYIDVSMSEEQFESMKQALSLPDEMEYDNFAFDHIDLRMGLRHSNDSTIALYLMVVPRVKKWGNGMTVDGGNISLHRRHTQSIGEDEEGLEEALSTGVKTFLLKAARLEQEIRMLKSVTLNDRAAHHIMVLAASEKIIPWSTIGKVKKFWSEFEEKNAWALYMCFTRAGMDYKILREMGIVAQSRKLILEICCEAEETIREDLKEEPVETEEDTGAEPNDVEADEDQTPTEPGLNTRRDPDYLPVDAF